MIEVPPFLAGRDLSVTSSLESFRIVPHKVYLGVRTQISSSRTVYIYSLRSGVRIGWISQKHLDELGFEANPNAVYVFLGVPDTKVRLAHTHAFSDVGVSNLCAGQRFSTEVFFARAQNIPKWLEQCRSKGVIPADAAEYITTKVKELLDLETPDLSALERRLPKSPTPGLVSHQPNLQQLPRKETTMTASNQPSLITRAFTANKDAAKSAAVLEAGRVSNNVAAKLLAEQAPLMLKGYIDTPVGRLIIANAASMAVRELRANDKRLTALTEAMLTAAYAEAFAKIDVQALIEKVLDHVQIKEALAKLGESQS